MISLLWCWLATVKRGLWAKGTGHFIEDLLGVVIGFLGVFTMIGTDMLSGISANLLAHMAILCATLSYAFAGIFGRRFKAMGMSPKSQQQDR